MTPSQVVTSRFAPGLSAGGFFFYPKSIVRLNPTASE